MWLKIASFPLLLILFVLSGQFQTIDAQGYWQVVYGDRSTKKYYSTECGEVANIDQANRQGFKTSAAAEKAGFIKGETCSALTHVNSGVQFFGDKSKKSFYPLSCTGTVRIASEDWVTFATREDAEKLGYKIAECPVVQPTIQQTAEQGKPTVKPKPKPMKRAALPRIVAITSEPGEWLGKLVTVDADVNITDAWKFDENTYSFRITDGSASFYIYMEKKAAKPLRDLILKQPAADGVYGQFTFYLNPTAYLEDGELYGRLVSYSVRAD